MPGRGAATRCSPVTVSRTRIRSYDIDLLVPGDKVIFDMPYGTFTYAITSITIVEPEQLEIIDPHAASRRSRSSRAIPSTAPRNGSS